MLQALKTVVRKELSLPSLIDKATSALESARTSAEVLEARDMARVAYDAAKSAARISKAKTAHDSIIADVHRAQAHALAIRARAEMRLAEEYDAAQERGEVRSRADNQHVVDPNKLSSADLGLRRDEIHEARRLRDAEAADPGVIERTVKGMVERGEEPRIYWHRHSAPGGPQGRGVVWAGCTALIRSRAPAAAESGPVRPCTLHCIGFLKSKKTHKYRAAAAPQDAPLWEGTQREGVQQPHRPPPQRRHAPRPTGQPNTETATSAAHSACVAMPLVGRVGCCGGPCRPSRVRGVGIGRGEPPLSQAAASFRRRLRRRLTCSLRARLSAAS